METATNVSIESLNTDESKLVLECMLLSDRRPQHFDTDTEGWNKKMTKTYHHPTTTKMKSPVDFSTMGERGEENERQLSSSEQLLFKNLSEAISEYEKPSVHRRHRGRAKNSRHEGAIVKMAPSQNEEPIIPFKRPRYRRRNSFVIRREDKNTVAWHALLYKKSNIDFRKKTAKEGGSEKR
jgi:hypothetical protein